MTSMGTALDEQAKAANVADRLAAWAPALFSDEVSKDSEGS